MSRQSHVQRHDDPAGSLIESAKRNPEALLIIAAGCALLMRGRAGSTGAPEFARRAARGIGEAARREWAGGVAEAAESAKDYASDVGGKAARTVSSYATSATDYVMGAGREAATRSALIASSTQTSVQNSFRALLRDQPLAIAAFGLASGAAVAALLPSTEIERRALKPARGALAGAAASVLSNVKDAAMEAGEQLKQSAAERLSPDGVKDVAREATDAFSSRVASSGGERMGGGING